jgi:mannitol/fructose-specific phosphotransferase system IIA component (Ntr-type)
MKLSELLSQELIQHPLIASDKWQAIAALARTMVRAGAVPEAMFDVIHDALVRREQSMTTGMEQGIAIPHAAVDGIEDVVAALGVAPAGVPFEALDGQPARIIVGLVIPRAKKLLHIKTLAEIAKLLGRRPVREALLRAGNARQALEVIGEKERELA